MLSRAARIARLQPTAAQLYRSVATPAGRPQFLASSWSRTFAHDNKPKDPISGTPSDQQKPAGSTPGEAETPASSSSDYQAAYEEAAEASSKTSSTQTPKSDAKPDAADATEAPEPAAPTGPLPDLTQGIPSTLAYEMSGATNKAALAAMAEEDAVAQGGGRGRGELPDSAYVSSTDKKRQQFASRMFLAFIGFSAAGVVYLGRNWDDKEEEARHAETAPNGWSFGAWWARVTARTGDFMNYYQEPAFEKLLPDPDPSFERPYTLCISLEDMLVHSEWTREHGWRVAKRPGVDYFLRYLSQYYELVLFTSVPFAIGEPLVRKLDPFRFIMWPLYREATKYKDGEVVKDLSYLNRDLSKVIILDTSEKHVQNQPENAIVLPKWTGDSKDKELVSLIPFLEYIHTMQYGDVRKVLKSFEGKHIPTEFARREAIARAEFNKQVEAKKKKAPSGMGMLGGMLGLKPSNMSLMVSPDGEQNPHEALAQGKMLQDIARERGQRNYELLEKEIRENGEKWLKEEAAMQEKAQQEAMQNMMGSFGGWFVKGDDANKKQ
ncbi:NLI interacting factor-like phosphatase [Colletotrichum higginsianum]|uniref:Mitochondrial import inner membrane translocase subunit TIM50 n=2 Tax=Colletotrichum higginsianum TaxID=80884 RepID=H1W423_COLHI|nr:NLI interacting factor-like phosphatase [Colletotrichum higginsianum IMI 349063]OBR09671.1 NLI interacting factor-like phosphatase [Colletotrichum higginsianum IMI 349063]TID07721.1 Mitochondrial import inner membrane translocase subunit TIM50 [Colletotrichum higginsianum]GJD03315.1 NLI interacting factor-like phosphatase [Colletotrichum higginsianum]CCF47236.1 NLI interacting factor-like phosphatase [Colletotrichum higginsianum]